MGVKRWLLRIRAIDYLLSIAVLLFIGGILAMSLQMPGQKTRDQLSSAHDKVGAVQDALPLERRVRRDTSSDSWSVPAEVYPITLGVPFGCTQASILSEFPNATCFSHCTASSCDSDEIASIESGNSELVCTAKIIQLGFQRSGTGEISRWIKQHSDVTARYADIFIDGGEPIFDVCPIEQLRDTAAAGYFEAYPLSSIGGNQKNYYVHCEHCLTTSFVDLYFGTLFLDLPTAMLPFIQSSHQKIIVTIKNPTDRAIAEYFYSYIVDGTDLDTVGGQTLHDAMSAGIEQAKDCMVTYGPTACAYGHQTVYGSVALDEAQMLYDGCYSTHLTHVLTQISQSQTYFLKIEEYSANPYTTMQDLYNFLGLDYAEPPATPTPFTQPKYILPETITMMDEFYAPFNSELRDLLGDDKWLYTR